MYNTDYNFKIDVSLNQLLATLNLIVKIWDALKMMYQKFNFYICYSHKHRVLYDKVWFLSFFPDY